MKTFIFTVPRKKEEIVNELWDIIEGILPEQNIITKLHVESYRIQENTLYSVTYVKEDE